MWLKLVNGRQGDLVSFNEGKLVVMETANRWDGTPAVVGDWAYVTLEAKGTILIGRQVVTSNSRATPLTVTGEDVAEYGDPTEAWDALFRTMESHLLQKEIDKEEQEARRRDEYTARHQAAQAEVTRKDQEACAASGLEADTWEFRKALRGWDRHYAFSDDSRVWRAGKAEGERLKAWFKKLSDEQKAKLFAYDPECRELARG